MQRKNSTISSKNAVVTGLGAVSALGLNSLDLWNGLSSGKSGVGEVNLFDVSHQRCRLGAQAPDLREGDHFSRRELQRLSRCDVLALMAAREALQSAGLLPFLASGDLDAGRVGVVLGAGAGGSHSAELYYRGLKSKGRGRTAPSLLCAYSPAAATDAVATQFGAFGPRSTIVTACSSSNTAIGYAADLIHQGICDIVITGGADALSELTFTGFNSLKAISPFPCRPFDASREGLTLGEASGILVLENRDHAQARRAMPLAEFLGYGVRSDAYHMTAPDPNGLGAESSMRAALDDAGLAPSEIDYISAHGTATTHNDPAEAKAIARVFNTTAGRCTVPVSALKSALGHCLGAAAAIEAVALVQTLQHQWIPPTLHHHHTDPECPIDCVPNRGRPHTIHRAMSNSFAFGGNNTAIILGRIS